jgi:hypothetical protein
MANGPRDRRECDQAQRQAEEFISGGIHVSSICEGTSSSAMEDGMFRSVFAEVRFPATGLGTGDSHSLQTAQLRASAASGCGPVDEAAPLAARRHDRIPLPAS